MRFAKTSPEIAVSETRSPPHKIVEIAIAYLVSKHLKNKTRFTGCNPPNFSFFSPLSSPQALLIRITMVVDTKYYEILQIETDADELTIKKVQSYPRRHRGYDFPCSMANK